MPKKRALLPRRNRALELAMKEVDHDNRTGLIECIEAGLPHVVEKYGHHSYEARSAHRMLDELNKK